MGVRGAERDDGVDQRSRKEDFQTSFQHWKDQWAKCVQAQRPT